MRRTRYTATALAVDALALALAPGVFAVFAAYALATSWRTARPSRARRRR